MHKGAHTTSAHWSAHLLFWIVSAALILLLVLTLDFVNSATVRRGPGVNWVVAGTTEIATVAFEPPCGIDARYTNSGGAECQPHLVEDWPATGSTLVQVKVRHSSIGTRLIHLGARATHLALAWVAFLSLWAFAASVRSGAVFTLSNIRRLSRIGWAVVFIPLLQTGVSWALRARYPEAEVGIRGFEIPIAIEGTGTAAILGLFLVAVSRIFRWGLELQEFERAVV